MDSIVTSAEDSDKLSQIFKIDFPIEISEVERGSSFCAVEPIQLDFEIREGSELDSTYNFLKSWQELKEKKD